MNEIMFRRRRKKMVTKNGVRIFITVLVMLPILSLCLFAQKYPDSVPLTKKTKQMNMNRPLPAERTLHIESKQPYSTNADKFHEQTCRAQGDTITITQVDFEGAFPPSGWYTYDNDGTVNGEYFWGPDDNKPYAGTYSGWCARGGANGLDPQTATYPNNCDSWLNFGPFDLSDATEAELSFMTWIGSPDTLDEFLWGASLNGVNFSVYYYPYSSTWSPVSLDLKRDFAASLGDLTGKDSVWVAIIFQSNEVQTAEGAYVDDIVLTKVVAGGEDLDPPRNLVATPGMDKIDLQWEAPHIAGQTVELAYDDGTPSGLYWWTAANYGSAVRFTPPSTPVVLQTTRYFLGDLDAAGGGGDGSFTVRVLNDAGGSPGSDLVTPFTVTPASTGWFDVDLSPYSLTATGDFYIAIIYDDVNSPAFGFDPVDNNRAWDTDGTSWITFDETYFIRAVVETQALHLEGYNIYRSTTSPVVVNISNKIGSNSAGDTTYTDTDVAANTTYYYVVTAVYTEGESESSNEDSAEIEDMNGPVITHTPPAGPNAGSQVEITATITDDAGVSTATLRYRQGGQSGFQAVSMSANDSTYTGAIPGSSVTERGLEYYIEASDAENNVTTSPFANAQDDPYVLIVAVTNLNKDTGQPAGSYRMISVPLTLDNASPNTVLADDLGTYDNAVWRLFRYQENDYVEYGQGIDNFISGKGFWLITKDAKTIDSGSGRSVTTASGYIITLQPGWNMIGNPFAFNVDWADVVKDPAVENVIHGCDDGQGYTEKPVLVPWVGYFVKNTDTTKSVNIEIPPKQSSGSAKSITEKFIGGDRSKGEWSIQIKARVGQFHDEGNYIGSMSDARVDWDAMDFSEPPHPPGEYVSLSFPHRNWETHPGVYTTDFRPTSEEGAIWDFQVETTIPEAQGFLEFEHIASVPRTLEVLLIDRLGYRALNLRSEDRYAFRTHTGCTFSIAIGTKEFTERYRGNVLPVPDQYALGQNYPNPFNAETRICYQLPRSGHVRLTIVNLLGQEVKTLVEEKREAGYFEVVWDGRNNSGSDASSGSYFYMLKTKNFTEAKKLILLR
jgi:hypothetical protein